MKQNIQIRFCHVTTYSGQGGGGWGVLIDEGDVAGEGSGREVAVMVNCLVLKYIFYFKFLSVMSTFSNYYIILTSSVTTAQTHPLPLKDINTSVLQSKFTAAILLLMFQAGVFSKYYYLKQFIFTVVKCLYECYRTYFYPTSFLMVRYTQVLIFIIFFVIFK